jgi:Na+-transporting methylmalonyl-CoA/oxaloacetate decarboxylase gamma subunit
MKTQIITLGLLLAVISFTSCKNNEAVPQETPVTTTAPIQTDTTQTDSTKQAPAVAKDVTKTSEKGEKEEKGENEANEK